jgi:hypothetical protein
LPFYYDVNRPITTNGTTLTESIHLRALTVANTIGARLTGLYGTCRSGTAGGASLRVKTWATASTGGTSQTPAKRRSGSPAANCTWFNDASAITGGTTQTVRLGVGMAQTGGMGGWMPFEADDALELAPNGGANGNLDVDSIAVGTSVAGDITAEFAE